MEKARVVGKDHFLTVWGGGGGVLVGFKGGMPKKMVGGGRQKNIWYKGGGHQTNSFKFCSDGFCDKANNLPECQKPAFLIFTKFRFPPGSILPDPLLFLILCTKKQFYPTKIIRTQTYHCEKK